MFDRACLKVAVEGPSDSGKSALVERLRSKLGSDGVIVLPCYVDIADRGCLPNPYAASVADQLAGLDFYLALDRSRKGDEQEDDSLVIADRCWLTLVAHTYAVEQSGGPAAFAAARARVEAAKAELFQPDLVLALAVDPMTREARADPADRDRWFTEPTYNRHFDDFMRTVASDLAPGDFVRIDGSAQPENVGDEALAAIRGCLGAR